MRETLSRLWDLADGKKTYLTAGVVAGVTLARMVGWLDEKSYQAVLGFLAALGLYAVRDGIRKLEK